MLTPKGLRMAAVLACGPGAALSHGSAAVHLGLSQGSARMHVTVPRNGPHSRGGLVVHRVRRLPPEDVTVADGIPVTTWARTALDVAETRPVDRLLEQAEVLRIFDLRELHAVMARNPGRRGLRRLAAALARLGDVSPIPASVLERRFLALCRRMGLPDPEREALIGPHHVDFLWRDAGLVVEADSRTHHEIRAAFERDRRRDIDLAAHGLRVLRVTSRQLDEPPPSLLAVLAR